MKMKNVIIACAVGAGVYLGFKAACAYNDELNRQYEHAKAKAEERLAKARQELKEVTTLGETLKDLEKMAAAKPGNPKEAEKALKEILDLFGDCMTADDFNPEKEG